MPLTPQQKYVNDMNSQFSDYLPGMGSSTSAGILDFGAQMCEALGTGGNAAAAAIASSNDPNNNTSEENAIIALTKAVLCPVPGNYQSKYQNYVNALKAAGVYRIVASQDSNGDPVSFASTDICGASNNDGIGGSWDQGVNMTQAQADAIVKLTGQYLCPGQTSPVILETITFQATGSNITYGPAGSQYSGTSGMDLTQQIPPSSPPAYYAISTFYGSCKLTVLNSDGSTTTSQASAPAGLANCELVNLGGTWQDANSAA